MWQRFCDALDAQDLFNHPQYATAKERIEKNDRLKVDMTGVTKQFSVAELVDRLNTEGVPCGPINTIGEAFEDEQVKFLRVAKPADHPTLGEINLIRSPINLSAFPQSDRFDNAAPDTGQDTQTALASFGIDNARIAALLADGVVGE